MARVATHFTQTPGQGFMQPTQVVVGCILLGPIYTPSFFVLKVNFSG